MIEKTLMNPEDGLLQKVSHLIASYKLPVLIGFVGLVCVIYGLVSSIFAQKKESSDVVFTQADASTKQSSLKEEKIVIDIEGAVVHPGIYSLEEGSRVQDAFIRAGGMAENADRERITKQFNLAAKVSDGMKIYVPFLGESITSSTSTTGSTGMSAMVNNTEQININTASGSELDTLPGIGKVTADKITAGRPYGSINELLEKKIVKKSVFEKIKDLIVAY